MNVYISLMSRPMALDGFKLEQVKYVLWLSDKCALGPVQKQIFTWTILLAENSRTCARQTVAWRSYWARCHGNCYKERGACCRPSNGTTGEWHALHENYKLKPVFLKKKMKWHFKFVGIPRTLYAALIFLGGGVSFSWYLMTCLFVNLLFLYFRKKKVTQTKRGRIRNNKRKDTVSYAGYLAVHEKETNFILHFNHLTKLQWCLWIFSVSNIFISFQQ